MRHDRFRPLHIVKMPQSSKDSDILRSLRCFARQTDEGVRKAQVEVIPLFDLGDVLCAEPEAEGLDVGFELFCFAAAEDWVDVRGLGGGAC